MPRQTRKTRKDKSQPAEEPRQVRAEEVADSADEQPDNIDELLDTLDEQEPEAEQQDAAPTGQDRTDEDTVPKSELVEESPEERERERLAFYESLPALLTSSELGEVLNVARTTVYSWRLVGYLPEPIRILPQIGAVWLTSEIREWLASGQWADDERARTVYKLFKQHGEDLNEWIHPQSDTADYLQSSLPVGVVGDQKPIRNEQQDAALDDIEEAFTALDRVRGTVLESEALALIANRLSFITKDNCYV